MASRGSAFGMVLLLFIVGVLSIAVYTGVVYFTAEDGKAGVMIDTDKAGEIGSDAAEESRGAIKDALDGASDTIREAEEPASN